MRRPTSATPEPVDKALYWGALPVVLSAPLCAADRIGRVPGLLELTVALILIGLPASYWMRRRGFDRVWVNRVVSLVALALGVVVLLASQPQRIFSRAHVLDANIDGAAMTFLIRAVAWVIAWRCLTLLTDIDILLSIGFSLSLFVLDALVEPEDRVLLYLWPCAVASIYLVMRHQRNQLLRRADQIIGQARGGEGRHEVLTLGALGGTVAALAILLSVALGGAQRPASLLEQSAVALVARMSEWLHELHNSTQTTGVQMSMGIGDTSSSTSPAVVFEVRTEQAQLWRANVYGIFDGREWRVGYDRGRQPTQVRPGFWLLTEVPPEADNRQDFITHRFRLGRAGQSILYTTPSAVGFFSRSVEPDAVRAGVLTTRFPLPGGARYGIVASTLPTRGHSSSKPIPDDIAEGYFNTSYRPPARVTDLARVVAGGARGPEAKMQALMRYLATTKYYTRRPRAVPEEADAVDYFLFEMDTGWCRHFASALAVLGREVGVPTRLVDGYLPGEMSDDGGTYTVRERDAHAWVEAWLPASGWTTFDPTELVEEELSYVEALALGLRESFGAWRLANPAGLPVGAGTLAGLALGWWAVRRRRRRQVARRPAQPPLAPAPRRLQSGLMRIAARLGLEVGVGETVSEIADRITGLLPDQRGRLHSATDCLEQLKYGPRPVPAEQCRAAAGDLREVLRAARKDPTRRA